MTGSVDKGWRRAVRAGAGSSLRGIQARRAIVDRAWQVGNVYRRVAVLIVAVYLVCAVMWGPTLGVAVTGGLLASAWLVYVMITRPRVLVSILSTVISWLLLAVVIGPAGFSGAPIAPLSAYLLVLLALVGPTVTRRHNGSRAATVVLGQAGVLLLSCIGMVSQITAFVVSLAWVLGVIAWRGGGVLLGRAVLARARSGVQVRWGMGRQVAPALDDTVEDFTDEHLAMGATAEVQTAAALLNLPEEWRVLNSRCLPGTQADLDHLAIGPGGVFVIDSKDWRGRIHEVTRRDPETGERYTTWALNGDDQALIERLSSSVFEASLAAEALCIAVPDVQIVLAFSDRMAVPDGMVQVQLLDVLDAASGQVWDPVVTLVSRDRLVAFLDSAPTQHWSRPGWLARRVDAVRGVDPAAAQARRDARYLMDLSAVADYVLPPQL